MVRACRSGGDSPIRDTEPEHYPLALTLPLTGIRYGEATALRWSDIDEAQAMPTTFARQPDRLRQPPE